MSRDTAKFTDQTEDMMPAINPRMDMWRLGELSDSEILGELVEAHVEIYHAIRVRETKEADEMWERIEQTL